MVHVLPLALLLAAQASSPATYRLPIKLGTVVKAAKARALPPAARAALKRDGSVVVAGHERHFFALYDRNAYQGIPSFVTLDALLHVVHIRFDEALRRFEQATLAPQLQALAAAQAVRALGFFPKGRPAADHIKRLAVYHAVPFALLAGSKWRASLSRKADAAAVAQISAEVDQVVTLAQAASGPMTVGACPGRVDFSLFKPRGHYDRDGLRDYFRAMSFYHLCAFQLDKADALARALDLVRLLDTPARQSLARIEKVTRALFGLPDDHGVDALSPLAAALPALPAPIPEQALAKAMRAKALGPSRIPKQHALGDPTHPTFALLGAAATPDGLLFAATTDTRHRPLPSALDLMAALGSQEARQLLGGELRKVEGFAEAIARPFPTKDTGFYGRCLEVLRLALVVPGADHPPFERTPAWARRLLVTASGYWAELRHDSILYTQQMHLMVLAEGGDPEELPPTQAGGYVEPRPEIYRALGELTQDLESLLGSAPGLPALRDLLAFATRAAELELAGAPVPRDVDQRLKEIGAELEQVARGGQDVIEDDAVVADVATAEMVDGESSTLTIREVATGNIDEIWVVVPRGKRLLLTRGAVFSYYEFDSPTRLTDEEWREMLGRAAVPRPGWAMPAETHEPLRRSRARQ